MTGHPEALAFDASARLGVRLDLHGPTAPLPAPFGVRAGEHAVALQLGAAGWWSGHRWCACDQCGEARLVAKPGGRCILTPRCKGKTVDPLRPRDLPELGPCARTGCERVAYWQTARGEAVCRSCLFALSLLIPTKETPQ